MHIVSDNLTLKTQLTHWRDQGQRIAFVPTMGNLHAGHLALVNAAQRHGERVVVSIFVNPTQFSAGEDFTTYPRSQHGDCAALESAGVDLVYLPSAEQLYSPQAQTHVSVSELARLHCGAFRAGHFDGVATVVCKLFNLIQPHCAVFGLKDYQQFRLIQQMCADLFIPVALIAIATVRDENGLAMSSRNQYLTAPEKQTASKLYQTLCAAQRLVFTGMNYRDIETYAIAKLKPWGFQIDYFNLCHADTLQLAQENDTNLVILAAVRLGNTRLIDNICIENKQPNFIIHEITDYDGHQKHLYKQRELTAQRQAYEKSLLPNKQDEFSVEAYCYVCQTLVNFLVDFKYSRPQADNTWLPNWRERLVCPRCQLNNRMRATVHIFQQHCQANLNATLYITEQMTTLYRWFKQHYQHVYGSEYIGDSVAYGGFNERGIRNEDITQLSFAENQFDYILSFDVFEHIPNYQQALKECLRCLKPQGILLFSVPFIKTAPQTLVRALLHTDGSIEHLLPAEYHGDPINKQVCLCFYHFGWDLLSQLRALGFIEVKALAYSSKEYAYLGGEQLLFSATKP